MRLAHGTFIFALACTAIVLAQDKPNACPHKEARRFLMRDRESTYADSFTKRVAARGIAAVPMAARLACCPRTVRKPVENGGISLRIWSLRRAKAGSR